MSNTDEQLGSDARVVGSVLQAHLDEFFTYGLSFKGMVIEGSSELGYFPVFQFGGLKTDLEMRIVFSSAHDGFNGGFSVTITKLGSGRLHLADFLEQQGRASLAARFRYRDPQLNFRSFAQSFVQTLLALVDTDLKPIIEGRSFSPTPFDWQGLK